MGRKRRFNDKEKWCPRCGGWLKRDRFSPHPTDLSGLQPYCKEHQRAANKARRNGPLGKADRLIRLASYRRKKIVKFEEEAKNFEALANELKNEQRKKETT